MSPRKPRQLHEIVRAYPPSSVGAGRHVRIHGGRIRGHRLRCRRGPDRSSSRNDHALQRSARADGLAARGRLHATHRHQGQGALGRRGDARESDHAGRLEVAGRCLLRGEPAGLQALSEARAPRPGACGHPGRGPARTQRAVGGLGRDLCACSRARLQHGQAQAGGPPQVADGPRLARLEGALRDRSR